MPTAAEMRRLSKMRKDEIRLAIGRPAALPAAPASFFHRPSQLQRVQMDPQPPRRRYPDLIRQLQRFLSFFLTVYSTHGRLSMGTLLL